MSWLEIIVLGTLLGVKMFAAGYCAFTLKNGNGRNENCS